MRSLLSSILLPSLALLCARDARGQEVRAGTMSAISMPAGVLGSSRAVAIDDEGVVVGSFVTADGTPGGFVWTPAAGAVEAPFGPLDVNNQRQILGLSGDRRALLWTLTRPEEAPVDLGDLGGGLTFPGRLNNAGDVIGSGLTATGESRNFLWTPQEGMMALDIDGSVTAINDARQLAGYAALTSGATHGFRWVIGGEALDLGTLGGDQSRATAINDAGQVVGWSMTSDGPMHAFRWTLEGGMTDLGTLGGDSSAALGINNAGQVVGWSKTASGARHACLWKIQERDGNPEVTAIDLGTLGGDQSQAFAINARGDVVGWSAVAGGGFQAFLWKR